MKHEKSESKANWITLKVSDKSEMRAYVARPSTPSARPGVIVLQEAFGVNAHIRDITERVASLGYTAVAPELFHRVAPGFEGDYGDFSKIAPIMSAMTREGLEADLRASYDWLSQDAETQSDRIAAMGFCMGGRSAFLAATILPLKAAVSYYGGRIVPDLLPQVPHLQSPLLLIWGGKDKHIGPVQQRAIADALREAHKAYVDVEFSEADHGFLCDARPSFHPVAARQAWALTTEFLDTHLR